MIRSAVISQCGLYRYTLVRRWPSMHMSDDEIANLVVFIELNPSTADGTSDDPTIRRCINFAKAWGYGGLVMLNLFAFRSTKPSGLLTVDDPIGPENDWFIKHETAGRDVVACWGANQHLNRIKAVMDLLAVRPKCLGRTAAGHPRHPLYVKNGTELVKL